MLRAGPQRSPLRTRYGPPRRILARHDRERAVAAEYRARRLHVAPPLPNGDVSTVPALLAQIHRLDREWAVDRGGVCQRGSDAGGEDDRDESYEKDDRFFVSRIGAEDV